MAAGLFELRKDPITGWWVATMVDRAFHRDRFARAAEPVDDRVFGCSNCTNPEGDGVRVRMLKDFAFHVVGTGDEARELDKGLAQVALSQARATGSWRTVVAPPEEHRPLHAVGNDLIEQLLTGARDALVEARAIGQTDYLQVVQNWGAQAGARTNHLCLDLYDLPQIPHRIAEELGGAARFVIREGECPFCRLVREESRRPDRLIWEDHASVAFAPYASRSSFETWIVPRRHEADFGLATVVDVAATAEALRQVLAKLAASLDGPPYNLVLHTAPLKERVDATYHWHWEIHPRLREIAGLELGTGLPVNPVSPEDAVEELLGRTDGVVGGPGDRIGPRRAPASHGPGVRRLWANECALPIDRAPRRIPPGVHVAVDRSFADPRQSLPAVRPTTRGLRSMSGTWDRDEAAVFVETLFAKHEREIFAYLLRMMRDPEVAADMTQDAFIKAYKNYDTLEKPENARAWLYQIAHRVALDEIRRRKIVRFFPWTGESHGAAPSAEHLVMDANLSGDMQRALAKIPERQRAALLLAEVHDLTGIELAAALGVSHVAARALLTRARESLRQALAVERAADLEAEAASDAAAALPRQGGSAEPRP